MKNYVKPAYLAEEIDASDIILTSVSTEIISEGTATVGQVTGAKGTVEALFDMIFKFSE